MATCVGDDLRPIGDTLLFALKPVSCRVQSEGMCLAPFCKQTNMVSSVIEGSGVEAKVDNGTLMNCVQNYRCIDDKTCKDYRVPQKKRNAWREIAEKLQLPADDVQKRYNRDIRTVFSKDTKRQRSKRSGSGVKDVPELTPDLD